MSCQHFGAPVTPGPAEQVAQRLAELVGGLCPGKRQPPPIVLPGKPIPHGSRIRLVLVCDPTVAATDRLMDGTDDGRFTGRVPHRVIGDHGVESLSFKTSWSRYGLPARRVNLGHQADEPGIPLPAEGEVLGDQGADDSCPCGTIPGVPSRFSAFPRPVASRTVRTAIRGGRWTRARSKRSRSLSSPGGTWIVATRDFCWLAHGCRGECHRVAPGQCRPFQRFPGPGPDVRLTCRIVPNPNLSLKRRVRGAGDLAFGRRPRGHCQAGRIRTRADSRPRARGGRHAPVHGQGQASDQCEIRAEASAPADPQRPCLP